MNKKKEQDFAKPVINCRKAAFLPSNRTKTSIHRCYFYSKQKNEKIFKKSLDKWIFMRYNGNITGTEHGNVTPGSGSRAKTKTYLWRKKQ